MKSLVSLDFVYIYIDTLKDLVARNCNSFNMLVKRNLKISRIPLAVALWVPFCCVRGNKKWKMYLKN